MNIDTISDMLTRIRNANLARHQIVQIPATKVTRSLTSVLVKNNYIDSYDELENGMKTSLLLFLRYKGKERLPCITHISRASKPGLRLYTGSRKIPRILGGFGTAILSTSKGFMTDKDARSLGIGGEIICYIW